MSQELVPDEPEEIAGDAYTACTVFDPGTGAILWTGTCSVDVVQATVAVYDGEAVLERVERATHYLPGGVKTERPTLEIETAHTFPADGAERTLASDLPAGTEVYAGKVRIGIVDDGALIFTPIAPETLTYRLEPPFPLRPITITIAVHEVE